MTLRTFCSAEIVSNKDMIKGSKKELEFLSYCKGKVYDSLYSFIDKGSSIMVEIMLQANMATFVWQFAYKIGY